MCEIVKPIGKLASLRQFQNDLKPYFSSEDISILYSWSCNVLLPHSTPVLLHRDFHNGNSLVDKDHRLLGVFDWVNAAIGDPEWDFIPLYMYCLSYPNLLKWVLHFYEKETGRIIDKQRIIDLSRANIMNCMHSLSRYIKHDSNIPTYIENCVKELRRVLKKLKKTKKIGLINRFLLKLKNIKEIIKFGRSFKY